MPGSPTLPLGYSSAMPLEKPGSEDVPPRRGQIGKQPRPKLAVLKPIGPADTHARQRSISGTELHSLREWKEPAVEEESSPAQAKGKGRATAPAVRPEPVRSHSISGIPNGFENRNTPRAEAVANGHTAGHVAGRFLETGSALNS